jgi:hypothetical protein
MSNGVSGLATLLGLSTEETTALQGVDAQLQRMPSPNEVANIPQIGNSIPFHNRLLRAGLIAGASTFPRTLDYRVLQQLLAYLRNPR